MKFKHVLTLIIVCMILFVSCPVYFFVNLYYKPFGKLCYPLVYPHEAVAPIESFKLITNETDDSFDRVKSFYTTALTPSFSSSDSLWSVKPTETGYQYECLRSVSKMEIERGCIYIHQMSAKTVIEVAWIFSETNAIGCFSEIVDFSGKIYAKGIE